MPCIEHVVQCTLTPLLLNVSFDLLGIRFSARLNAPHRTVRTDRWTVTLPSVGKNDVLGLIHVRNLHCVSSLYNMIFFAEEIWIDIHT